MTELLHAIYRHEPTTKGEPDWTAYSYPTSIYASGYALEHVRDEFREAAEFLFDGEPTPPLAEHVEHQVADGVFVRVAVDRHSLDREYLRKTITAAMSWPVADRPRFSDDEVTASGDVVVICAVGTDRLSWVLDQMDQHDALHIALAISDVGFSLASVAGPDAVADPDNTQTLTQAGLSTESTVGEFMATVTKSSRGSDPSARRLLVTANA